jgi:hypothetical protein
MDAAPSLTQDPPSRDALPNFSHRQILRVITGVLLCILLAAIDQTVVVPAVPAIAADLHGFGHLSWIVSAYLLTSTAATPIYGRLSDIYGRRALLLPAIVLFVIASGLCALSQSLWQLIAFRALQGVGGAGLMAMAQACIADVVAPRERGKYQAYMAGTWLVDSHISESPSVCDGAEVFEAMAEGNGAGRLGFGIAVPASEFGDDPCRPGQRRRRVRVLLERGFPLHLRKQRLEGFDLGG